MMNQFKPIAKVSGFVNLPENQYQPILSYLANSGPLAISVDASTWSSYSSGVYDGCDMSSPDLDHIVQLVGAGTDPSLGDYWLVSRIVTFLFYFRIFFLLFFLFVRLLDILELNNLGKKFLVRNVG
jgi:hypothetical protein